MPKCGIYKITNLVNNKSYIGQSINIVDRWRHHRGNVNAKTKECYNYPLYWAMRKYGLDNFKFEILEECSKDKLNEREDYYIHYYNTLDNNGYNQALVQQAGTKITPKIVLNIIEYLKTSDLSTEKIGELFHVSGRTVRSINIGETWFNENYNYPIRKKNTHNQEKTYCIDCKKEIHKGYTRCNKCANKARIISTDKLPITREELKNMIRTVPFTQIGKKYGYSDNAIRKWCIKFNLPSKKKEINSYSDKEWEQI